jgi:hypothetical protein
MPTAGLSLVGFMADEAQAIHHLRNACVPNPGDRPDGELRNDWISAKGKIESFQDCPSPGLPTMTPIDHSESHIQRLLQCAWAPQLYHLLAMGASFQMVEIDPLLAFQHAVDTERSNSHCSALTGPPTKDELFELCFPPNIPTDDWNFSTTLGSMVIRSRSLNLGIIAAGPIVLPNLPNIAGIQFGWSLPFVHVVRYNGRCYLHNGFHRTYGAACAGAKAVPCIFRDVKTAAEAAIMPPHTISLDVLESQRPPTVGHFVRGAAWDVRLRQVSRIINVTWSQHSIAEE